MSTTKNKKNKIAKITMSTALVASSFSFVAPLASANQFSDVKSTNSHFDAIYNLAERGIIQGYTDGTFKPGNYVKRSHVAKIIAKALNLDTGNIVDPQFKDVDKNSEFYPYIAALANAKIIDGFDGKFNPEGNVTRGQMAKMIARAFSISATGELSFKDVPATHEYAKYISALAEYGVALGKEDGKFAMHELVTRGQLTSFVTRAEKANASTAVVGVIESISGNTIKIAGKTFKVTEASQFLVDAFNKSALADAKLVGVVKDQTIIQVQEIELFSGSQFDGGNQSFAKLSVGKSITQIKNVTATEIRHELPSAKVIYTNVEAQKLSAKAARVPVASLNNMIAIEQDTSLKFDDSKIEELDLNAKSVDIEASGSSEIRNLNAPNTSRLNLTGIFNAVQIPGNAHITGQGSINQLVTDAVNASGISVAPGFTVNQFGINNAMYPWAEAVAKLDVNSSLNQGGTQTPGGNTNQEGTQTPGGNTNPGGTQTPGGNTNPGGTQTPGGNTNQGGTQTPGGNTNQDGTQTPGGNTNQGGTQTPGGNTNPGGTQTPGGNTNPGGTQTPGGNTNQGGTQTPGGNTNQGGTQTPGGNTNPGGTQTPGGNTNQGGTQTPGGNTNQGGTQTPGGNTNPGGTQTPSGPTAAQVKATIKEKLATFKVSNTTTEEQLEAYIKNNVTGDYTFTITAFSKKVSSTSEAGNFNAEIEVKVGNTIETLKFTETIEKLEAVTETTPGEGEGNPSVPEDTTAQDTVVDNVLAKVEKSLAGFSVTNDTTLVMFNEKLAALAVDGVKIEVTQFGLNVATVGKAGNVTAQVTVTKGEVSKTYQFTGEVAALPEPTPVDPELGEGVENGETGGDGENPSVPEDTTAQDTEVVDNVLAEVENSLADFSVTNDTTLVMFNEKLADLAIDGVKIEVTQYDLNVATAGKAGNVTAQIIVSKGKVSKTYQFTGEITALPIPELTPEEGNTPSQPVDTTEQDVADVQSTKLAISNALASYKFKNDTKEADINSLSEMNNSGVKISVTSFSKSNATDSKSGSVQLEIEVVKNKTTEKVIFSGTIDKIDKLPSKPRPTEQRFDQVPQVSADNTIQFGDEAREVAASTVETLAALQQMSVGQPSTVQLTMAEDANSEKVVLQAVTIETADTTTALDLAGIPSDVDVVIIGDNLSTIQNLQQDQNVTVQTSGDISFEGEATVGQVTLTNAAKVKGLKAKKLIAQNSSIMSFDETTLIGSAEFNGVDAVSDLNAGTATFVADRSVAINNVKVKTMTISDNTAVASRAFKTFAALNSFANTSVIKITVEGSTTEDLIISREDVVVDIQKGNTISKVSVKTNNVDLVVSEIGSIAVEGGVSYLRLGTADKQAKIAVLDLVLDSNVHIAGNAVITQLNITQNNASAKVKKDSTITITNNNNPGAMEAQATATYSISPGTMLGRYTINNIPADTYFMLLSNDSAPATTMPIGQLAKYGTYVYLDSTVKRIALYSATGNLIGQVTTNPKDRPAMQEVDVDRSAGVLKLNVTTPNLAALQNHFKHLYVFTHGNTAASGYVVNEAVAQYETFDASLFTLTPKTNQSNSLQVKVPGINSLGNIVIVTDGFVYDKISPTNKDQKLKVLKALAQHARANSDDSILYNYLTTTIAVENKTYDSIFMNSIIDHLLADSSTSIDALTTFIEGKVTNVKYNKIVPTSVLLLGTGVEKLSGDDNYSEVTIEGSNLLIESISSGTEVVRFKDTAGNISLLKVTVDTTATTEEGKITTELIATEVNAKTEILHGDARLVTTGGKTYLVPATLGLNTFIYTLGANAATVGIVQSAITDATSYAYTLTPVATKEVLKSSLNLTGVIERQKLTNSGYVTTDTGIHFYVMNSTASGVIDQFDIQDGNKSTAVALVNNSGTISEVIASKNFEAVDLGLTEVKSIEAITTGTTMHTAHTGGQVGIFAAKQSVNTAFKVTSQDNKVTLINGIVTNTNGIQLNSSEVVKTDLSTIIGSASIIVPTTQVGELKEDVIRFVGNVAYATATGNKTQRVVLTDGRQIDVKVVQSGASFTMSVDESISQVAINATDLHLQNIESVTVNGSSVAIQKINNLLLSVTGIANQNGKTELIVTDSAGKKTLVYVDVVNGVLQAIDGTKLYKLAKRVLEANEFGFTTITSVSEQTATARAIHDGSRVTLLATGGGNTTFTVIGEANKTALVNVSVERDETLKEMVVKKADVVKLDMATVDATKSIDPNAVGGEIVRIEGDILYALKEGTVDIAIKDNEGLYYRVTVIKDAATGQYSFATPELISKAVFSATELGLTDIISASSSDEDIATVAFESNKIVMTTQTKDAAGYITVIGSNGRAFVYMKKAGNILTTAIEKSTATVDVGLTGLANINSLKEWSNDSIVRSYEAGTVLDFFAIQDTPILGKTAYTVTDSTGKKTIINLPVTMNVAGNREIAPQLVRELVGTKSGDPATITPQTGEIISGSSVRLYAHTASDTQQYAFAVGLGDTLVKLADGTLVKYTVSITDGLYAIQSEAVTNGVTKTAAQLGLTGNVTISGIDPAISTAVPIGDKITFHGQVNDGETSLLVSDATHTVRVKVAIAGGTMTVETIKYDLPENATAINIHESVKDIAWITADGKTIYVLKEGVFRYVEKDSVANTSKVQQLTIGKSGTAYPVTGPEEVPSIFKSATELGLVNALQVQPTYNTEVVYAGMVGTEFVAYQIGTGSTDVTVKDGQGQSTLMHMTSDKANATLIAQIAVAKKADNVTPFTFEAVDYDLSGVVNVTVKDLTIAERHTNGQLYLLKQGTTYATVDNGAGEKALVTIVVSKPADQLVATITPIVKTATQLAPGATTVTALPGVQTDTSIVRVVENKVYAVGAGETKAKLNGQIVNILVKEEANTYTITIGTAVNFIEIPIANGTYTVADITNTNAVIVTKDDKGTVADTSDDKLIISVNGLNGLMDITITDGTKKTVYHVKVENGEFVNLLEPTATDKYVKAWTALTTDVTSLTEASDTNDTVQINGADLHLLKEGKAALQGDNGLVNVNVTRNATTKYLEATQTVVEKEIKETFTEDTKFDVVTKDSKNYIRSLKSATYPVEEKYYTDNYRIVAKTDLVGDEYVLTVEERHKQEVDFVSYGLKHEVGKQITLHSDNEDIAKAEIITVKETINGVEKDVPKLVVYAGAGQATPSGTTTITAKNVKADNTIEKQITIKVTRAEDGTISYEVQGQADALKFADLGLTVADTDIMEATDYSSSIVQANVTATGISLAAQTPGTTSLLVKQNSIVKAIVNISVADGKAIATVVKHDDTGLTDVITGDANSIRQDGTTYYAVAEGVVLYDKGTTATQLRIVKNTETNLYSITPTSFALQKPDLSTDLTIDSSTTLNIANSSVADAFVANNKLYIIGKSLGSTDILVSTGTNKVVVHAHIKAAGLQANVATYSPTITGTFTGNDWIQVRGGKLYALAVRTSTIKVDGTLVTAEVTRDINTNEFALSLTHVKHEFAGATTVKLVNDPNATEDAVVKIIDKEIYAKAAGKTQVYVDDIVRDVEVVANADGTFKIVVTEAKTQKIIDGVDLGLTLTSATPISTRAITGSNILSTQVIGNKLYVYALGTGTAELVVDNKAIVHITITSTNNVLQIAEPVIATSSITTEGIVTKVLESDSKIRLNPVTGKVDIYGLQEGISLVKETADSKDTLYKVLVIRENNVLKVSNSAVAKDFQSGDLTAIDNDIVRGGNGKLIAKATGTIEFVYNSTTYRVTVDATGEMTIDVLDTDEIELSGVLTAISGTPSSTLLGLAVNGTKLTVTAKAEGTEIIQVSGTPNTVLVKVNVTKDSENNYKLAYELIQTELTTTELGFHPKTVEAISNGITLINGSNVTVYPGKTVGKQYFKVTGEGGTQAIYSLNIATGGVKLENGVVKGYTVAPLHRDILISELGVNPVQVAIDGTAKYSIKTKDAKEVVEVVLNNTEKSYIIVRGEDGSYKSIEVQATNPLTNEYNTSHKIHSTKKLTTLTKMSPTGNVKSVNDGLTSVLYATGAGKFAYEDNGKLYNSEVTVDANGIYSISTPTEATVTLKVPRLVDGELNINLSSTGDEYTAAKIGEAIYATTDGTSTVYKKVIVALDANNQVTISVTDVPSGVLPSTVFSAEMIKGASSVKVDKNTSKNPTEFAVFGDLEGSVTVVSTKDGEGAVILYKVSLADGSTTDLQFTPLVKDLFETTGWDNTTTFRSITISDPSIARVKDNKVYFMRSGEVTINYISHTNLEKAIKYTINESTYEVVAEATANVIEYVLEVYEPDMYVTFDLNVPNIPDDLEPFIFNNTEQIMGVQVLDTDRIKISTTGIENEVSGYLYIQLPEYNFSPNLKVKLIIRKNGTSYDIIFESSEFNIIAR